MSGGGAPGARVPLAAFPARDEAAAAIVDAGRRLAERGLIAGPDGNLSVRLAPDRLLATPSGATKGRLRARDLVELALDGRAIGPGRASSEIRMHLRVLAARPDVGAVVHAHPPTATGFAVAGEDFLTPVLPELILQTGGVPLLPFAPPGGDGLAAAVAGGLAAHEAVLLANHGATTVGATLEQALQRMESLEHAARILLVARLLGRVTELTPEQVRALATAAPGIRPSDHPRSET